jgi:hypothetical protein
VKIAGLEFETSGALETLDLVVFGCGFADFARVGLIGVRS